jgi:MerR family transcriptional regulator/heat shock protein HspR
VDTPKANEPILTIGVAAKRAGVSESTLRLYEREGLVIPRKTGTGRRLYSVNDLKLVECVRTLIQDHGLNFAGIRALFSRIPCWRIKGCSDSQRKSCERLEGALIPCWRLDTTGCGVSGDDCAICPVYAAASEMFLTEED